MQKNRELRGKFVTSTAEGWTLRGTEHNICPNLTAAVRPQNTVSGAKRAAGEKAGKEPLLSPEQEQQMRNKYCLFSYFIHEKHRDYLAIFTLDKTNRSRI